MLIYLDTSHLDMLERLCSSDPGHFTSFIEQWIAMDYIVALSLNHVQELAQLADETSRQRRLDVIRQFGLKKKRIRPDYVIVPADQQLVAAVIEAKEKQSSLESHLRHATQVIVEQLISQAPWGIVTDGERWTLFRGNDSILHLDNLEDVYRGMADLRHLVGAQSIREQLVQKPTLTVLLLSSTSESLPYDAETYERLRGVFPAVKRDAFRVLSPASAEYNAIAAAAGDRNRWWEPDPMGLYYWPSIAARNYSQNAYVEAFTTIGYEESAHAARELDYDKIALFIKNGLPGHVAYQLVNGLWASKLGSIEEIVHPLRAIEGEIFGSPVVFMRRPRT